MNIDTTALATLFDTSPTHLDAAQGIASAYQLLLGGVPSVDGFTALINNAINTNFGAGPGVAFNQENVFINVANSLVQGNTAAATAFAGLIGGAATLQDQVTALYQNLVPAASQTAEGLAFVTRPEALAFYTAVAAERGVAGANGPAIVAMAAMANVFTESDVAGHGDSINDLIAAIRNNTSMLPQGGDVFTPIETADGTGFDADDVTVDPNAGTTQVLTAAIDNLTGTDNNDIFIGDTTTTNPGDTIDGGNGDGDTLNLFGTGTGALGLPQLKSVENISIKAAADKASFDVSGNADVKMIELKESGVGGAKDSTTVTVTTGQKVKLTDLEGGDTTNIAGNTPTELNVEADPLGESGKPHKVDFKGTALTKVNLTSSGTGTNYIEVMNGGGKLDTLVVDGKAKAVLNHSLGTIKTIDASATTGGVTVTDTGAGSDLTFMGGMGDDRIDVGGKFDKNDKFSDGKAGKDTLAVDALSTLDAADTVAADGFEVLAITGAGTGTLDVSKTGAGAANVGTNFNEFDFEGGLGGNTELLGVQDKVTVNLFGDPGGKDLKVDHKTDTTTDTANIGWKGGADQTLGTLSVPDAETINFNIDETADGKGLTINKLDAPDLNGATVNITGDGNLKIAAATASGLTKADGSTATGDLDLIGLAGAFKAATDITVTGGAGADRLTGSNAAGNKDTIDAGAGNDVVVGTTGADTTTLGDGSDIVAYTNVAQSQGATVDTITDFVSGTDKFDLTGISTAIKFVGNQANFGAAQGAIAAGGGVEAVFQADTNTLWVDVNDDGTLNNNDLQVKLTGVTSLAAADLTGVAFPDQVIFTAAAASTNTPTNTLNGNKTSAADNVISSTDAFLNGSTVDGQGGNDTLNVTTVAGAGFAAVAGGTITAVDIINLQAGGVVDLAKVDADLDTINTSAASTITTDANNSAITVNGGAGVDTLIIGGTDFTGTFTGGGGTDVISSAGGDINTATVAAETLTLTGGDTTLTAAQHAAFATIVGGGNNLTFSDAFTGTGNATVGKYTLAAAANNFTLGAAAQNVTESGGVNTVNLGGLTATGALAGFDGDDTAVVTTGGNITGVNGGAALGTGILDLTGLATMTAAQHQAFTTINAATPGDQINIADGTFGTITTDADVEVYNIGDDTGNAVSVTVNGAAQQVSATSNTDVVTFNLGTPTVFTGTITGEGTFDDRLVMSSGDNISGGTVTGVELLTATNAGTYTFTNAQLNGFTSGITTTGINTAVITDAATLVVDDTTFLQRTDFENFTLSSTGIDSITIEMEDNDVVLNVIDISAGGNDDILINNDTSEANESNDFVTITGFTAGDDIGINVGANSLNTFTTVGAGSNTDLAAGAVDQAVIEIAGANTISAATATDTSDNGNVELAILSAIGNADITAVGDSSAFVLYGDGNAYIYTADWTADPAGAALTNAQFDVELVAQVNNVVLGNLVAGDFI